MDQKQYYQEWVKNPNPENAFNLLATIGYLRRIGVYDRGIEIQIRKKWESFLNALGEFFKNLANLNNWPINIQAFYKLRDNAQLAFEQAKEYTAEEHATNYEVAGEIGKIIDKIDEEILLEPEIVLEMRKIGESEKAKYYDPDFFWWLPSDRDCHIPPHHRDWYITSYLDGTLPEKLRKKFTQHLDKCEDCADSVNLLRAEDVQQQILTWTEPEFAAAKTIERPKSHNLIWKDQQENWEMKLQLVEHSPDESIFLRLNGQTADWSHFEIVWANRNFSVSEKGRIAIPRQEFLELIQENTIATFKLVNQKENLTIQLNFQGEEK